MATSLNTFANNDENGYVAKTIAMAVEAIEKSAGVVDTASDPGNEDGVTGDSAVNFGSAAGPSSVSGEQEV